MVDRHPHAALLHQILHLKTRSYMRLLARPPLPTSFPPIVEVTPALFSYRADACRILSSEMILEVLGRSCGAGLCPGTNSIHPQLSPKPCRSSAARGLLVQARFAVLSKHYEDDRKTYERVLRYPSGQVMANT